MNVDDAHAVEEKQEIIMIFQVNSLYPDIVSARVRIIPFGTDTHIKADSKLVKAHQIQIHIEAISVTLTQLPTRLS